SRLSQGSACRNVLRAVRLPRTSSAVVPRAWGFRARPTWRTARRPRRPSDARWPAETTNGALAEIAEALRATVDAADRRSHRSSLLRLITLLLGGIESARE